MADAYGRRNRIDSAVEQAQTGTPAPRPDSRKSKWERAGMTRSEYERGIAQITEEKLRANKREADLERARRGQSNPGN